MIKSGKVIKVGISDLKIAKSPHVIRTSGLGSCVGIIIYDLKKQTSGLAHIMLPDSTVTRQDKINTFKYADTAIPILIERVLQTGARHSALQAKIAGGARMFQFNSGSDVMKIGARNIEAVKAHLEHANIPIIASDVGGNQGRTIEFDPSTGKLGIRTVYKEEKYI